RVSRSALPGLSTGVPLTRNGATTVTVHASPVGRNLLDRLHGVGAAIRFSSPRTHSVVVTAPLPALTTIASWPDLARVTLTSGAMTAREASPNRTAVTARTESKAARVARIEAALRAARAAARSRGASTAADRGAIVSEGDVTHGADRARAGFRVTGIGVKVCVLSDGVDSLAVSQAAGELPAVDVLPGQEGFGDEGTAMLEIVHDLAPNATLGFATAFSTEENFAQNILDLRSAGHCDIIVDDVIYFHED